MTTAAVALFIVNGVTAIAMTATFFILSDLRSRIVRVEDWILKRANGGPH